MKKIKRITCVQTRIPDLSVNICHTKIAKQKQKQSTNRFCCCFFFCIAMSLYRESFECGPRGRALFCVLQWKNKLCANVMVERETRAQQKQVNRKNKHRDQPEGAPDLLRVFLHIPRPTLNENKGLLFYRSCSPRTLPIAPINWPYGSSLMCFACPCCRHRHTKP